ncbi:MAG: serine/threonine protein kinase [Chlamydiia bacterium]
MQFYHEPTIPLSQGHLATDLPVKIGPYTIEKLLTTGTDTRLYLGLDEEKRQLAVIKVLSHDILKDPTRKKIFLKEGAFLKDLSHNNIVQYYGEGDFEEGMYIAVEFIQGISLKQFILQRSLSLKRSIDITLKVLYALLYLHSLGIVHRDLKPENILITENSEVKVVDFGIAGLADEHIEGPVYGTPSYMPPEERKGGRKFDVRSDIYAIGVIFYELVTGRISLGMLDLELAPKHLREIIQKATDSERERRYQDVMEMISDLSIYLKQGLLEKDEGVEDTLKDLLENIEKGKQQLIGPTPEGLMDLRVELLYNPESKNLNYTLLHYILPDGSYLALIGSTKESSILTLLELKGIMERGKLLLEILTTRNEFSLSRFLDRLELGHHHPIHLQLLHVSTSDNIYHLFSYGKTVLYHHSYGSETARELLASGRLFGKEGEDPQPINDRLDSLDTLLLAIDGSKLQLKKFSDGTIDKLTIRETEMGHCPLVLLIERLD